MSTVALLLIAKNWSESKHPSVGECVHKLWYVCNNDTCVCVCVCTLSHVQLFVTPWVVACHAPLPMELSRQEYWSELPFPPPGDLPNPGTELVLHASPTQAGKFFTAEPPGKPVPHSKKVQHE